MKETTAVLINVFIILLLSLNCNGQTNKNKAHIKKQEIIPTSSVQRVKLLEGRYVFSFINNGGSYFLIDLPIYEDGVVDCWEKVDLPSLKEKLRVGWLTPQVPDGKKISMFHLGSWNLESASWDHDKTNYYEFILSIIKQMNPDFENLFLAKNRSSFGSSSSQLIRKDSDNSYFSKQKGKRIHFFIKKSKNVYELANLNIYSDSLLLIDGIEKPRIINYSELQDLSKSNIITTELSEGSILEIKDLGKCKIGKCNYHTNVRNKILEVNDILSELNGNPTSSDLCYKLYKEYQKKPSTELRRKLKQAYESIPEHLRVYVLGDMDTKDYPIKTIIYEK